ncbi:MAG: methyltransferase family protein [Actinomycetota bacterium]
MRSKRAILWAAAIGAAIGVRLTRGGFGGFKNPFLATDTALLAHRPMLLAAAGAFILLGIYWEIAARHASEAKRSESKASRSFHMFLVSAAMVLEIAPIHGLGRFVPVSLWIMSAGLAMEVFGLLLAIWARRHLGRNWSGEITIKVEHELVRSGPYRRLRHPIYTGFLAMYAGVLLVTGEWLAVIGFIVIGLAYWRKIRMEEANLNVAFGAGYDAYRRETWALVPGIL